MQNLDTIHDYLRTHSDEIGNRILASYPALFRAARLRLHYSPECCERPIRHKPWLSWASASVGSWRAMGNGCGHLPSQDREDRAGLCGIQIGCNFFFLKPVLPRYRIWTKEADCFGCEVAKCTCDCGTMQEVGLRLMGKKLLVALALEDKFASEGLQAIDGDDDMLTAMARELVENKGIGESAESVWRGLQQVLPATPTQKELEARPIDPAGVQLPAMLPLSTEAIVNTVFGDAVGPQHRPSPKAPESFRLSLF